MEQYEDNHLGGCVKGGDPATFYPNTWNFIINNFNLKSILDIGCGEGHALSYFKEKGLSVLGIEGLKEAIDNSSDKIKENIILCDFTKDTFTDFKQNYDAVWCCEFVEHVEQKFENNFLNSIIKSGAKYVFLTHATPGQGGYHHVNLQHSSYWIAKLSDLGYELDPTITRQCRTIAYMENINPVYNHFHNHGLVFVKKTYEYEIPNMSAVITWMSGTEFCKNKGIKVYVNSLNKTGFSGDKLVFTHDMPIETREYLKNNNFKVIDCDPNKCSWVVRDRFLFWHDYLLNNKQYNNIGFFDSKDVVFQQSPINKIPYLGFISEGKLHEDCEWNMKDQSSLQHNIPVPICKDKFEKWPVICAGTIIGNRTILEKLCACIWASTALSCRATDQAVLNYLARTIFTNHALLDPISSNFCLTADYSKEISPIIKDGIFYNSKNNSPYLFLHQYDRIESYKKIIYERYL